MNKSKRLLVIIPFLALLFGCKKKQVTDNTKIINKTTNNKTVITTKKSGNITNNITTKSNVTTKKKNTSGKCHYAFVDYDGTVLLENDVTTGTTISEGIIPKPNRSNEGEYFYYFTGWDKEVNRKITDDVTYTAQYEKLLIPYEKNETYVYFGYYPQKQEIDSTTISTLNSTAKLPSTNTNWVCYNYYDDNNNTGEYMWYIDIDTNNDSRYDYRGIYFTEFRPYKTSLQASESNSYVDNNGFYEKEVIYWFKYEKIEWRYINDSANGKMYLLADFVLDSQEFYPDHNNIPFKHNGAEGYVNEYRLSEIRKWLNNEFYNTAFNETEQKIIMQSDLSTRKHSQSGSYSSSSKDYIYLLADNEVDKWFSNEVSRITSSTDYAKAQGVTNSSNKTIWGLRTPSSANASYSSTAISIQYIDENGNIVDVTTDNSSVGIRPCLVVKA